MAWLGYYYSGYRPFVDRSQGFIGRATHNFSSLWCMSGREPSVGATAGAIAKSDREVHLVALHAAG
jgi:hypothetical protein